MRDLHREIQSLVEQRNNSKLDSSRRLMASCELRHRSPEYIEFLLGEIERLGRETGGVGSRIERSGRSG